MQRFRYFAPDAILAHLGIGILMLDSGHRVRLIDECCAAMLGVPPAYRIEGTALRDLLNHASRLQGTDYRDGWSDPPGVLPLSNGTQLLVRHTGLPGGGKVLAFTDITGELRLTTTEASVRIQSEHRFSQEVWEQQAAHLASLAEEVDENVQKVEAARQELERELSIRARLEQDLRRLATTDGLTGSLNRAEFLSLAQRDVEQAQRLGQALSVLMLDVDHFKSINDRHGHAGGDLALRHLAGILRSETRSIDLVGRLGGEEFAIALPGVGREDAARIAERLRQHIAAASLAFGPGRIEMTVSIGITSLLPADCSIEQIVARADALLYGAKNTGRNRVMSEMPALAA